MLFGACGRAEGQSFGAWCEAGDEEAAAAGAGMPELLRDMAEAVLMSPTHSFGGYYEDGDVEVDDAEVSLWSYSI